MRYDRAVVAEEPSARVTEADCAEHVVVLKTRHPGTTSLVVVGASARLSGAGLLRKEARREIWGGRLPPAAGRQKPREASLVGGRVIAVGESEVIVEQDDMLRVLRPHRGRVVVTDVEDVTEARARARLVALGDAERTVLEERGESLAHALAEGAIDDHRTAVLRALERARSKVERRRDAVRSDLARIAEADQLASRAQWLVAEAVRAPRGAKQLVVTDWSTGEAVEIVVPLDPSKSAREQVDAMFRRAKRLRLGARIASDRLAQVEVQLAAIGASIAEIQAAAGIVAIDEAARKAKNAAPRDVGLPDAGRAGGSAGATGADKRVRAGRVPFRTFVARSGRRLLVGKGAADNDALTQRLAKPRDLWLHAKDRTGSHVVVPLDKGHTCPAEDLVDAAHLAAHFSDARDEKVVDVQYAEKRHLRKPKGSPPGFVLVDREKVLVLRVEPDVLRGLLEREETG